MATVEQLLPQLHGSFEAAQRDQKFAGSIALCKKILTVDAKQQDALNVLLYSLIQSEMYADALKIAARVANRDTTLERAYALYCSQRFVEAVRLIDESLGSAPEKAKRSLLRLKAQAQYRLGKYEESCAAYSVLCGDDESSNRDTELFVNALAAFLSRGDLAAVEELRPKLEKLDNSELAFNFGTALLHSKNNDSLPAAETQLRRARDLCLASCAKYRYSEADTSEEVAPILVQLAYAWQRMGRVVDARKTYTNILQKKPKDPIIVAIASNNLIALRRGDDKVGIFDSLKRSKVALGLGRHLSPEQLRAVSLNHAILLMNGKNNKACDAYLQSIADRFVDDESYEIVRASLLYRSGKVQKALTRLSTFAESHPGAASVNSRLHLAQQFLSFGKVDEGLDQLARAVGHDKELQNSLGFVSTLTSIHETANHGTKALKVLRDTVSFWEARQGKQPHDSRIDTILNVLRSETAKLQSSLGNVEEAAREFQELAQGLLRTTSPKDFAATDRAHHANLVMALSYVDPSAAVSLSTHTQLADGISMDASNVDVDSILSGFLAYQANRPKALSPKATSPAGSSKKKSDEATMASRRAATIARRRKKRRDKLRAAFVQRLKEEGRFKAGAVPDPERWLPRRLRKKNKSGSRRRGRGVMKGGAQGAGDASGRDSSKYDLAAQVKAGNVGSQNKHSTANTQARGSAAGGRKSKSKNRKKKKKK